MHLKFVRLNLMMTSLNLTVPEEDGSDPLGVQNFLQTHARDYHVGRVSTVYVVKQGERILAFFTLCMTGLRSNRVATSDMLTNFRPITYPAVLLGQMGVDKRYRGHRLGQLICNYCLGLAQTISEQIASRYIALETNQDKVGYYNEKCGFRQSVEKNTSGRIWMYRRLTPQEIAVSINETIGITENVVAVTRRVEENNTNNSEGHEAAINDQLHPTNQT